MDVTSPLALPYPEPTDPITDYPAVGQDLAERIQELMVPIAAHTVAGSALAEFDTNVILGGAIPSTFRSLRLILSARMSGAVSQNFVLGRLNGDSGANYDNGRLENSSPTTAIAAEGIGGTSLALGRAPGASATANKVGLIDVLLADYANTSWHKMILGQSIAFYTQASGGWTLNPVSGLWRNTAAITRLQVIPSSGSWEIGSRFALYGIA